MVGGCRGEQCKECGRAVGVLWRELRESCHESLAILLQEYLLVSECPGESCRENSVILLYNYSLPRGSKMGCLMNCKILSIFEKAENKSIAGKLMNICLK
jgi:hypothetical protein